MVVLVALFSNSATGVLVCGAKEANTRRRNAGLTRKLICSEYSRAGTAPVY
jgi:hypothetical protein